MRCEIALHTKLYSFRFDCRIVSLTAAKTNRIFSVSVAREKNLECMDGRKRMRYIFLFQIYFYIPIISNVRMIKLFYLV